MEATPEYGKKNIYMGELTDLGILSPKKDGKEVYYLNNDLLRILED